MKKFVIYSSLLLLNGFFFVEQAVAKITPKITPKATTDIVAASDRSNRNAMTKTIISEKHRKKQEKDKCVFKHLKKKELKISCAQHRQISKIEISGNKSIGNKEIESIVRPYLKKKSVIEKELKLITDKVEKYYRDEGYYLPVVHASIDGSALKLKVIEGKIKNVRVIFNNKKKDKKILSNQHFLDLVDKIERADPIKTRDLERYLFLISKIHGYSADYDLEPLKNIKGNEVANLVMRIKTQEGTASISAENGGTSDLGEHQFTLASQFFNPTVNDSLTVSAGTSDKPKRFKIIAGGYLKRLNSYGTSASLFASYLKDNPYSAPGSKDSKSVVFRGRLDHYVVLNNDYSVKLEVGAEKRSMESYVETVKAMDYSYVMGLLGGKIKIVDKLDVENWFYPYYNWILSKVSYKKNSEYERNFDRNFNLFAVDWYRNQPLPKNFSLFLKASYQYTDKNLPLEHVYSVGTAHTGRGYKTGLVSSDQGISGSAELRYTKEFEAKKIKKFLETGQIFGFYDVTHFIKHNKDEARKQHKDAIYFDKSTLPAVGVGFRLFFAHDFYGEGTAEYPFVKDIKIDGVQNKNKSLYRFLLSKEFTW